MLKKSLVVTLLALAAFVGTAAADVVCPSSSYCVVSFATTKTRVTIAPQGGETFAATGITLVVYLKNCNGAPLVGVPAQQVLVSQAGLCICPGGNIADAATDINGMTQFTGTIRGGGCADDLIVYADGVPICMTTIDVNSPDHVPASPCAVDASDLSGLAAVLGSVPNYTICKDYNESGPPTVDASDLSFFASYIGGSCL